MKNSETLGLIKDAVDNLLGALELPMPATFHVEQMKHELQEVSERIKNLYIEETDENPWEY